MQKLVNWPRWRL